MTPADALRDTFTSTVDAAAAFERNRDDGFDYDTHDADCQEDGPCVGECVCGDFPPCDDQPDAANDSLRDARWEK